MMSDPTKHHSDYRDLKRDYNSMLRRYRNAKNGVNVSSILAQKINEVKEIIKTECKISSTETGSLIGFDTPIKFLRNSYLHFWVAMLIWTMERFLLHRNSFIDHRAWRKNKFLNYKAFDSANELNPEDASLHLDKAFVLKAL